MKGIPVLVTLLSAAVAFAGRVETPLGEGWTADGVPVTLPHTWNAADGADGLGVEPKRCAHDSVSSPSYARKTVVYRHALPDPKPGRRLFIRFEGVSQIAKIRVNGYPVQAHAGAFTEFTCDLTSYLFPGGTNALEVTVDNRITRDVPPAEGDFTLCGGIYRGVRFIETDRVCIDPMTFGADGVTVDADAAGRVRVTARIYGARQRTATFAYEVAAPDGTRTTSDAAEFTVPDARPWTPETPNVYRLMVRMTSGECQDEVTVPFGFRKIELREDGFYLNGVRRQIRGVNRHQDRKGKGWAVSDADIEEDIRIIREMGADAIRTSHYPPCRKFYELCDRYGLMVWSEIPLVDDVPADSASFPGNALHVLCEMVAQRRNHPCVVLWGLFNELYQYRWDDGSAERIVAGMRDVAKAIDPSRPTVAASGAAPYVRCINAVPDGIGFNMYPGWYGTNTLESFSTMIADGARRHARRTVAISEYGAGGSPFAHGEPTLRCSPRSRHHSEEYQAYCHLGMLRGIRGNPDVWGSFAWVMFDAASDARVESDGFNDKGLVTGDRRIRKDAYYLYKANWTDVPTLHLVGSRLTETTNATMTVIGFSNVGETELLENGRSLGKKAPDEVCSVTWPEVRLASGSNRIELKAGGLTASADWRRTK